MSILSENLKLLHQESGKTFEEIRDIINLVEDKSRVSVCFDTCHVHDSGYDIKNDFNGVIKHFDEVIGLDKISVIHVNDTKNEIGARKDYINKYANFNRVDEFEQKQIDEIEENEEGGNV